MAQMYNVFHVNDSTFNEYGHIKPSLNTPYMFIMVQTSKCPHCTAAKPAFQALSNKLIGHPVVTMAVFEMDKDTKLSSRLKNFVPLRGVPSYFLYKDNRYYKEYNGDRTEYDLLEFLKNNCV